MRQWLDTHVHLLYPERLHYDWTAGLARSPHSFHLRDYLSEARSLGIGPALHMEADVREADIESETELIEELAQDPLGPMVGGHFVMPPESTDGKAFASFWSARPPTR